MLRDLLEINDAVTIKCCWQLHRVIYRIILIFKIWQAVKHLYKTRHFAKAANLFAQHTFRYIF